MTDEHSHSHSKEIDPWSSELPADQSKLFHEFAVTISASGSIARWPL